MGDYSELKAVASRVRQRVLHLIHRTRSPHIGPSFSAVEILVSLYFGVMKVDPADPVCPERDRFILSKGHASAVLYAVLAEKGFLTESDLAGFAINGGTLEHHPNRDPAKGIEVSTGSLGHGLAIGAGMALAARHEGSKRRVYVLMGDGELNEGSVWEAAMFAAHHKLDNLVAVVDANGFQALGPTNEVVNLKPLAPRWSAFGWQVSDVDGHDFPALLRAFAQTQETASPRVVIAHTTKGKGVSFMEDKLLWHYRCPDPEEYALALKEVMQ